MKRFIITLCLLSATPFFSHAQTVTTINARVLPTLWYSSLSADEGETVTIYTGIQNDSGTDFSGTITFTVDGVTIGSKQFNSKTGTVERVGMPWRAVVGQSSIVTNVEPNLDKAHTLVSLKSDTSFYKVSKKITLEGVTNAVSNVATNVVTAALEKIDTTADTLSAQLETYKVPEPKEVATIVPVKGRVLGTSTAASITSPESIAIATHKAKNVGITILQFLLAHWRIASSVVGVSVLAFVFLKR